MSRKPVHVTPRYEGQAQEERYRVEPANRGEKSVILEGWVVKCVCVDADHAALAAKICRLLNQDESTPVRCRSGQ